MAVMSSRSMSAMADEWRKRNVRPGQTNWARSDQPAAPVAAAAGAGDAGAGGADATMQGRQLESALSGFEQTRSALVARGLMSGLSEKNIRKLVGRAWGIYGDDPGSVSAPKRSGEIGAGRSLRTMWGPDGRLQTAEQAAERERLAAERGVQATPAGVGGSGSVAPMPGDPKLPGGMPWQPGYLVNDDGSVEDFREAAELTRSGSPTLKSTWDNAYAYRRGRG